MSLDTPLQWYGRPFLLSDIKEGGVSNRLFIK